MTDDSISDYSMHSLKECVLLTYVMNMGRLTEAVFPMLFSMADPFSSFSSRSRSVQGGDGCIRRIFVCWFALFHYKDEVVMRLPPPKKKMRAQRLLRFLLHLLVLQYCLIFLEHLAKKIKNLSPARRTTIAI